MKLRPSERRKAKIKMALQGSAGSGKTYSSLLLAQGLTNGNFSKVAIIDTENGSADLYAHLGNYNVLSLQPPYTPENYIKAIEVCEQAGMEVIIIDSISHAWDELLDFHSKLAGNSFTNWAKVTPRQKAFTDKILQCNAHVIATMRTKQDYVLNQKDGKFIPEKVGLKAVQRDGIDFEFTLVFDIDIKHFAVSSKDRTGLFMDKPEFRITSSTGQKILEWCNEGAAQEPVTKVSTEDQDIDRIKRRIGQSNSIAELLAVYKQFPEYKEKLRSEYEHKKSMLMQLSNPQNFSQNGHSQQ